MITQFLFQLIPFLGSAIGFAYGAIRYFRRGKALFLQIIVSAVGCMMLGRLFILICFLTDNPVTEGFHVGYLGILGCFQFLFSAGYGQMDGLVDGKEKKLRKYRLAAAIAPLLLALSYLPILLSPLNPAKKCADAVIFFVMMLGAYYQTKQLLLPDVEFGILNAIRLYNALALAMTALTAAAAVCEAYSYEEWLMAATIVLSLLYLLLVPAAAYGVKQWTM